MTNEWTFNQISCLHVTLEEKTISDNKT